MAAVAYGWTCPHCGEHLSIPATTRTERNPATITVSMKPTAMLDVYTHMWTEHPEYATGDEE